ncbi:STT3 domain-containing protein [Halorientalis regularis]|uniref:dolichyl-phosphooligosaccharide-protein glycotransferase n=1 Tax=Halorientalis regularis TaxID=660518 RepID=A0A1G7HIJ9_9EURY|nr:STT3 domain-containing protein [Halorientalis regularis]SDF00191.1 dolichyl-diphosphooligosaccharide--protein glycosyltransferase [Halorientalis regularis]
MADERDATATLEERPELASALESLRPVDDAQETWTFEDVPIDSGTFGELVSADLVEKVDGEYRLPEATRRALDGDADEATAESNGAERDLSLPAVDVDARAAGALSGALAVVVIFRTMFSFGSVFRDGAVVLSGNDLYFYRYYVEGLLTRGGGFDAALLSDIPLANGEPFVIAALYWLSDLFGGTASSVGTVMAWYPVASALLTGLLLYVLAVRLTDDRRVGLAAVVFLATTPAHALRTSLGFADHHAFDYPWLVLTALTLVVLAAQDERAYRDPGAWVAGVGLGIGVAGQILAWENGPALVVPIALVVALAVLLDIGADRSPLQSNAPLLGGLALAALVVHFVHGEMGWHTDFVAAIPLLLVAGAAGVLAVGEVAHRLDLPTLAMAGTEVVGAVAAVFLIPTVFENFWGRVGARADTFFATRNIVETQPLISGDFTWFLLLGLVLVLALPPLLWASRRATDGSKPWLVAVVYTWYFLALAAVQVRFVGELAAFTALFGGLGFVWLAHWVDLAAIPRPFVDEPATPNPRAGAGDSAADGGTATLRVPTVREAGLLVALFLLVGGVGVLQTPIKTSQVTIEGGAYQSAAAIDDHATAANLSYPDDYVLSQWARNRMFNYFVNGESRSYGYARQQYRTLYASGNESQWYRSHRNRVGYVVTESVSNSNASARSLFTRLHDGFGSRQSPVDGLAHFRAVFASDDGTYKAFRVIPGATITGTGPANATTTLSRSVDVPGAPFTYERQVRTNAAGEYAVTVPYPGEYRLWNETVSVSERNVTSGDRTG